MIGRAPVPSESLATRTPSRKRARVRPSRLRTGGDSVDSDSHVYDGFISYSHAADGRLAPALQHGLQRFAKPWYRMRALRIFRDEASLAADPGLWDSIREALDGSKAFILLASPAAAQSPWIAREIEYWKEHKSTRDLTIGLTDGDVAWDPASNDWDWSRSDALPAALEGAFAEEPRFVDLRWARNDDHLSLSHPRFRDAIADIAAPLHGKPKDVLASQEVREHRRTMRIVRVAIATLVGLLLLTGVAAGIAVIQRNEAVSNQETAESRLLAALAEINLARDASLSTLLALEGLKLDDTSEAEAALRHALGRLDQVLVLDEPSESISVGAAYSRDGTRVVTASELIEGGSVLRLWDARIGRRLWKIGLDPRTTLVTTAFTAAGLKVVTTGLEGETRMWDARDGKLATPIRLQGASAVSAAFSPDASQVVVTTDRGAAIHDTRTGGRLIRLSGHVEGLSSTAYSPDGSRIVAASDLGTARIWDAASGRVLTTLAGHSRYVLNAAFAPGGGRVVTAGDDGTARVWSARTGAELARIAVDGDTCYTAAFSPNGRTIVTANGGVGRKATAQLWDARAYGPIATLRGHTGVTVSGASFSPDGSRVLTSGNDGTARIWNAQPRGRVATLVGHTDAVNTAAFSPDGSTILTAADDGRTRLWDARTLRPSKTLGGDGAPITSASFNGDGSRVVTGGDRRARVWDARTGRLLLSFGGVREIFDRAVISPDATRIVTTGPDDTAKIWDARSGRALLSLRGVNQPLVTAAYSPDGSRLVTTSYDGVARIWDAVSGRRLTAVGDPRGARLLAAAFSDDGSEVVTAADDGTARTWDLRTGRQLVAMVGHAGAVNAAAFGSHDSRIVTAGTDGTARIWDARTGRELTVLAGHKGSVADAAFSPDGSRVVTAGLDRTVRLWSTALAQPLPSIERLARRLVTRPLTAAERRTYLGG